MRHGWKSCSGWCAPGRHSTGRWKSGCRAAAPASGAQGKWCGAAGTWNSWKRRRSGGEAEALGEQGLQRNAQGASQPNQARSAAAARTNSSRAASPWSAAAGGRGGAQWGGVLKRWGAH